MYFQPFDPWEYMKCVLRLGESSTGESEIVKTEWNGVHELNLRVIVLPEKQRTRGDDDRWHIYARTGRREIDDD